MGVPAGPGDRSLAALVRAFVAARAGGDQELIEHAALDLPSGQHFGAHPGQVPALVHEAYVAAVKPASKCRLAAALARAWAYGGDAHRAIAFADEAEELAAGIGDKVLLADALDAALLVRWGPDSFGERLDRAARLENVAGHLADPEARLAAHLWRLTTAWESLDAVAVQRQLRALDILAEETGSGRMAFFARSRRAMHALVTGDLDAADQLVAATADAAADCGEPDVEAVTHSLAASRARRVADVRSLKVEAEAFAAYGSGEGIPSVSAEAAVLWLEAGEPGAAAELLHQLAGSGLEAVPKDVDFLLTVTSLTEVGSALGVEDVAADGLRLLAPYLGRAVLNAGAVTFHGVVDHYLFLASRALGLAEAERWSGQASTSYQRLGANWWQGRLGVRQPGVRSVRLIYFRQGPEGGWTVGEPGAAHELPDLKGLHYLRYLLAHPGAEIAAAELAAVVGGGHGGYLAESAAGEVIDQQALTAYQARLQDLEVELAEAESWADEGRLVRLRLERDALLDQVAAATGLSGRRRRFSSADERARIAVRKAIAATLNRIELADPLLARILRDTVHTGLHCQFDPDPVRAVTWVLDPYEKV